MRMTGYIATSLVLAGVTLIAVQQAFFPSESIADARRSDDMRGAVYDETPTGTTRLPSNAAPDQRSNGETQPIILAQNAPAANKPPVPAKPASAKPAPAQPAQAQPAPAAQQDPNAAQMVEVHGEWKLQCFGRPLQRCELQQRRIDAQTQATIFWVEIARTPNASDDTITVITPLGMRVSAGVTFSIDGQLSSSLQPQTCLQFGCLSQLKANRAMQQKLVQAKQLRATVTTLAGQKLTLEMPTTGIVEGYNRMFALTNTR